MNSKFFVNVFENFSVMLESSVLKLRHASVVFWFDGNGVPISIHKVEAPKGQDLYRRKKRAK